MDVLAECATIAHLMAQALSVIVYCMMSSLTCVLFNEWNKITELYWLYCNWFAVCGIKISLINQFELIALIFYLDTCIWNVCSLDGQH